MGWINSVARFLACLWGRGDAFHEASRRVRSRIAASKTDQRSCKGCGQTYHKDWGWMCPNCTGAD